MKMKVPERVSILILVVMLSSACSEPSSRSTKPADPRSTPGEEHAGPAGRNVGEWEILRSELRRHMKRGAGVFISKVRVRAEFVRNRFFGWRVISYAGPGKKIQIGDIITSVNDKSLERPNQFMAVWNRLARKDSLVVKLVRQGKPMELRYKIVD